MYSLSQRSAPRKLHGEHSWRTLAIFTAIAMMLLVWQTFRLESTIQESTLDLHINDIIETPPQAMLEGPRSRVVEAELLQKHRKVSVSKKVLPKPHWLEHAHHAAYPVRTIDTYEQKCPETEDINHWIRKREYRWKSVPEYMESHGIWQNSINDKMGGYLFARKMGVRTPRIEFCTGNGPEALVEYTPPSDRGFVVKNLHGHSSNSVYVMESGYGGRNRLTDKTMTLSDIQKDLRKYETQDIYVEELIEGGGVKGSPPDDYKFFMFNGVVGTINLYRNRGTDQHCLATYDEHWNRNDKFGCFLYSDLKTTKKSTCPAIKASTDDMKGRSFCSDLAPPKSFPQMIQIVKSLSKRIGVFMRIDMFEDADGNAVLGEFTPFSTHGRYNCVAKVTGECIDSCFLGRLWKEMSNATSIEDYEEKRWEKRNGKFVKRQLPPIEGGPITPEPDYLKGWANLTTKEKCARIEGL